MFLSDFYFLKYEKSLVMVERRMCRSLNREGVKYTLWMWESELNREIQ